MPRAGRGPPGAPSAGTPAAGTRGIDARRFAACVAALLAPVASAPGAATGTGPQISIAWPAAVGVDDLPAHLAGYGTVPAEMVRHLLRDTGFREVLTHPTTGRVVAADGHVHPAGVLPDLSTRAVAGDARDAAVTTGAASRAGAGAEAAGRTASSAANGTTVASIRTTCADHDPDPDPAADPDRVEPSGAGADPEPDAFQDSDALPVPEACPISDSCPISEVGEGWGPEDDAPSRRRRWDGAPLDVPDEVILAGPGPGWDEALGGYDDGTDPVHLTGPDATDLEGYVHRSPTCTAPGCRAPAHRCDLDHTHDHAAGGPTCPCNATPLCRRHHTAQHRRGGWRPPPPRTPGTRP